MKIVPFVVFMACAAIAGAAGAELAYIFCLANHYLAKRAGDAAMATFFMVLFGLASLVLPVVIVITSCSKEQRKTPVHH